MGKAAKKTDNGAQAHRAKVEIRRNVLSLLGDRARVFDAFAGSGQMYDAAWKDAAGYVGCDTRFFWDGRTAFVADNRRVMRCIDLSAFGVFDLDAYGSPWEQALILAARRPVQEGERLGLILTEGSWLRARGTTLPYSLAQAARVKVKMPGKIDNFNLVVDKAVGETAKRMNCAIVKRWEARGKTSARMRYIGLVLEGKKKEAEAS